MARRRPTAFEVSFPELVDPPSPGRDQAIARPSSSESSALKRKNDGSGEFRPSKRQSLPPTSYYRKRANEQPENDELVVPGEDPDDLDDDDEIDHRRPQDLKPIRLLSDFTIFDPKCASELVSLASMEEVDGLDRQFEGAGMVLPYFVNDEDDGQEDEFQPVYVRLGAILRCTVDYTKAKDPFYIETQYAWYILKLPSKEYQPYYKHFYLPRRVAQIVVSSAMHRPQQSFESFLARFICMVDALGRTHVEQDLWDSIPEIQSAVDDSPDPRGLRNITIIKYLLRQAPISHANPRAARLDVPRRPQMVSLKAHIGSLDLAVLKTENQNPTHVTPRIAALARGLISEELVVIGPPPPQPVKAEIEAQRKRAFSRLKDLMRVSRQKSRVDYRKEDRLSLRSNFLKAMEVNGTIYHVDDYILVPRSDVFWPRNLDDVPQSATISEYFWYAKIRYIKMEEQVCHVQWLEHGRQLMLDELAHDQELFLENMCGHVDWRAVMSKIIVHRKPDFAIPPNEYFYKFAYDPSEGKFTSIDMKQFELANNYPPPDNCPPCLLEAQRAQDLNGQVLRDDSGIKNGVSYAGKQFHLDDFVLYRAEEGPANIGYIVDIKFPKGNWGNTPIVVVLKRVGRISSLGVVRPFEVMKDERHLYLTEEEETVELDSLIRVVYVFSVESFGPPDTELADFLKLSPDHFYVRYQFPAVNIRSWEDKKPVTCSDLFVCTPCCKDKLRYLKEIKNFLADCERNPLPTLDLFGGVGAFSNGLARGSGCLKVTHAIEISPSAAKTFMRNSPETKVFNQCTNVMLRYAIKAEEGHQPQAPSQLFDDRQRVPEPPKRGEIKVITAGFPCQTHSTLNMFKVADDVKSNLILNALSWIDYLRPVMCYFENVAGFLNFSLNSTQLSQYRVEGGISMGGLKLVVRALIDMGYQVRYGLLQAAHYGTPQRRVRFFLIGSLDGTPLPEFPQPSHDFPNCANLGIKVLPTQTIRPIRTTNGVAPHTCVTIDDAISDLPRFDWKTPRGLRETPAQKHERRERERRITALECKKDSPYCGYKGVVQYHHAPNTTFQQNARQHATRDLQHYTKTLKVQKVGRVVSIPLNSLADYRSLPPNLFEWQIANPSSSVAKLGNRPGWYGRLDKGSIFPTTVTNVDPTAKQSRVLNPYCKRMVTVRELARSQGFPDSFVFEAIDNNIVTMHRQIGNAVPLPLANALGQELRSTLYLKWKIGQEDTIVIDDDGDDDDLQN